MSDIDWEIGNEKNSFIVIMYADFTRFKCKRGNGIHESW